MPLSLRARVGLFAVAIPLFMVAAGLVLYLAYQQSLDRANIERLTAQLYSLLAVAEPSDGAVWLPESLQDERFNQVQSGLFGQVRSTQGDLLWQSHSALGITVEQPGYPSDIAPGKIRVQERSGVDDYLVLSLPVRFGESANNPLMVFEVWQDQRLVRQESRTFTTTLAIGLGGLSLLLMLLIGVLIGWVQKPLNQVVRELGAVEKAERETIDENYPREIAALTKALNTVLHVERKQRERYRNSLGDLAHSLKTPLAVIRGELNKGGRLEAGSVQLLQEQVGRMDDVITYQLKRASSGSTGVWAKPVKVQPVVERITSVLGKVYQDRGMSLSLDVDPLAGFLGDESDLMEIIGNLTENAFKYGDHRVSVTVFLNQEDPRLTLIVSDDGVGIPEQRWEAVLQRGVRLDSRPIGQGIGLSVVADLVAGYDGKIQLLRGEKEYSGARICIRLPGAALSS
ncbi:two-component sensor histidine kinase [Hahella sp. CCB-MM4]|uniref:ATP-binding protein n=1 Tax=Hahella sp. (strain CCB-MM4) TaxID=1926491 RepID=UPI000B9BE096|nr:ATP-binding protein [Hahella sp. CCB-MM4]OZG74287.1 two-component sensor histidine kinase [Hahella sp. CCB-MM4]